MAHRRSLQAASILVFAHSKAAFTASSSCNHARAAGWANNLLSMSRFKTVDSFTSSGFAFFKPNVCCQR
jgi:hypothetical protein